MLNETIDSGIMICEFDNGRVNTMTRETLELLDRSIKKAGSDDSIKGIILTGAGKTFSAGFDLSIFAGFKDHAEAVDFFEKEEEVLQNLFICGKPVISAINGHAIANGLILALASDYRIAKNHPKIKLSMSEIKLGISLTITMNEVIKFGLDSNRLFRDVMFSGNIYDVTQCLQMGIVDELAEEDKLMERAGEMVNSWSGNPGNVFAEMKKRLRENVLTGIRERMKDGAWKEGLKVFFNEETRNAIKFVHAAMNRE